MTVTTNRMEPSSPEPGNPPLEPGDHLDRETFHARYLRMPAGVRAELVEGIVHMPSPTRTDHAEPHASLIAWLVTYRAATPGTRALDNATVQLWDRGEHQPDAVLIIRPECGGQTTVDENRYLAGAPELVVEVASSSAAIDLYGKRRDYERAGVREYLVILVRESAVVWFVRKDERFEEQLANPEGILRSEFFPGLWLDTRALFQDDVAGVLESLRRGLESPEHAAFVASLR